MISHWFPHNPRIWTCPWRAATCWRCHRAVIRHQHRLFRNEIHRRNMVISWWFHLNLMRNFGETRWSYGTFHGIIMGNGDFSWFNQRFDGDNTGNVHGETAWNWWYSPIIKRGKLHIPPKKWESFNRIKITVDFPVPWLKTGGYA